MAQGWGGGLFCPYLLSIHQGSSHSKPKPSQGLHYLGPYPTFVGKQRPGSRPKKKVIINSFYIITKYLSVNKALSFPAFIVKGPLKKSLSTKVASKNFFLSENAICILVTWVLQIQFHLFGQKGRGLKSLFNPTLFT